MPFCRNCGKELQDGVQFCPACGTPVDAQSVQTEQIPPEQVKVAAPTDDVNANRGIAWLSYMGLLLLIPLFARKRSKYCEFHVRQGAILLAFHIAYTVTSQIFLSIIDAFTRTTYYYVTVHSGIYYFFNFIFFTGYVFLSVIAIIGIVNAAKGKEKQLPLIGKVTWFNPLMDAIYRAINK